MPRFYCGCAFHRLRPASARFETTPLASTDRTTPRLPNCCEIFESPLRCDHRQTGDSCRSVAVVLVVRSARSNTGEARRAVRIASHVMRHLRMRAEWPLELHRGRRHVVRRVLRRDEPARRLPVLDPILDSDLQVVQGVPHGGHLPGALSDHPCARPARAVPHAGNHEQAIELLRLLQPAHRVRHGFEPIRAVRRLQLLSSQPWYWMIFTPRLRAAVRSASIALPSVPTLK